MEEFMHFQFLIEDQSGQKLIETLIQKVNTMYPEITYNIKSFRGIGGFTLKNTVKETKSGKLLNDLATYLRGFNRSLQNIDSAVFVVLDNDSRKPSLFRQELENVASKNSISIDHVFCIAVEEMEAWLLGDEEALLLAYPRARMSLLHAYVQDSICGTWETLAETIYEGGLKMMKKNCPTYMEKGKQKAEWAMKIGIYMDISRNRSQSFNYFISELMKRVIPAQ
jgi:hypothetical protein